MRKIFALLVVILIVFVSCTKQDNLVPALDVETIRAQLVSLPILTKDQVEAVIAGPKLKDGSTATPVTPVADLSLIEIVDLDSRTYFISNEIAIKNMLYLEINYEGYRKKMVTIHQTFKVKNGQIDTNSYTIDYEIGCSYSRDFQLDQSSNVSRVTYFFRFNSGKQIVYYGTNAGNIKLPPIANGKWQLMVDYWDGEMNQQFITDYVKFYDSSNIVNVRLALGTKNTVSTVVFDRNVLIGAYNIELIGLDKDGIERYLSYPVMYDNELPARVSFDAPFDIKIVRIQGMNQMNYFETRNVKVVIVTTNVIIYNF
ncbi:hypothetical protein HXX01_02035 [Candidatus Nomurabacteria bacterium]|nr:hypothetical protein [Candidatus Nomurabacteria bacterium]